MSRYLINTGKDLGIMTKTWKIREKSNIPQVEFTRKLLIAKHQPWIKDTKSFLFNILFTVQIHISRLGEIKGTFFSFLNILLNKNITTIYNHS